MAVTIHKLVMKNPKYEFLKSATCLEGRAGDIYSALSWVREQNERINVNVQRVAFDRMSQWKIDSSTGMMRHESGHFFSIEGIRVSTNWGRVSNWDQPIINQPEIGYLGLVGKKIDGVLHFLLQAKIEPGNVNHVQLSPTIQATRSNYTQVHKGKKPLFLDYFQSVKPKNVLLDQLQSEQGARFYMKRNRNIIIHVPTEIPVHENFIWLTLAQIKELMRYDNLVNMDTRTVISGIDYGNFSESSSDCIQYSMAGHRKNKAWFEFFKSSVVSEGAINSISDIIHFLTSIKSKYDLNVDRIPLKDVKEWSVNSDQISRNDGKYFKVIAVDVSIGNREVVNWQQPMIQPSQIGICAFVCKVINGLVHLVVHAKLECGNRDIIELAPTVQCLTGDYRLPDSQPVPFLDYVLGASGEQLVIDTVQSEEGGRFYKEQNRNMIVMADSEFPEDLPENYIWMTLNQLHYFNRFNNYLNIQSRSLLSAISFT